MSTGRPLLGKRMRVTLLAFASALTLGCAPSDDAQPPSTTAAPAAAETELVPIRVSGSYWIELSPVLVAANSF